MLVRRLPIRLSTFSSLQQLLTESNRAIDTHTLTFRETFEQFSQEHSERVSLSLNRLLPVQEKRVEMILGELMKLSEVEKRAFFAVFEEVRSKKFMGANYEVKQKVDELETGKVWPLNHPRNLQFQYETQQAGQVGLHGLPTAFLAKLESGEAYQSLDSVEVSAAPAGDAKQESKVEEVKEVKTSFNLVLKGFAQDAKLKVIKEIKTIMNLGLKEAKDKVESTAKEPYLLYKNVTKESLQATVDKLTAAGAIIEWV